EDSYGRDQLLSIFFRLILPKDQAELYGEFGRNDHSQNGRDLILEPEHARAYLFGFRKIFPQKNNKDVEAYLEIANLQSPSTLNLRALEGWYTHYQVRQGYTNMGQVIGAGIGPGSGSQTLGVNFINGINKTGLMLERIVWNNDFYYNAFAPTRNFGRHWVDLSATFNRSMTWKRFILEASLSLIRSYNYQWNYDYINNKNVDVMNVHSTISIVYPF
ncbi:MAG TPA: hypothetical protein VNS32_25315, partial [Flavisolibacter sp.]|nr:hypothetical protein [Flavisolibacter sp.]